VLAALSPKSEHADLRASEIAPEAERLLNELAVLRVATHEACERACRVAVRGLAEVVLGRELRLEPVEIETVVADALAALSAAEPVAVAVAPCDAARLKFPLPVVPDVALRPGDLIVQVRDGFVDARLKVRLTRVLDTLTSSTLAS
jgi:flagellar biosynthesis/type III secretory pathway protein FliH